MSLLWYYQDHDWLMIRSPSFREIDMIDWLVDHWLLDFTSLLSCESFSAISSFLLSSMTQFCSIIPLNIEHFTFLNIAQWSPWTLNSKHWKLQYSWTSINHAPENWTLDIPQHFSNIKQFVSKHYLTSQTWLDIWYPWTFQKEDKQWSPLPLIVDQRVTETMHILISLHGLETTSIQLSTYSRPDWNKKCNNYLSVHLLHHQFNRLD